MAPASAANPGVPPSSLMSFLRVKPAIAGVVLTEFDQAFTNPFTGSRFDGAGGVDDGALARAGAALALALHSLASAPGVPPLQAR